MTTRLKQDEDENQIFLIGEYAYCCCMMGFMDVHKGTTPIQ